MRTRVGQRLFSPLIEEPITRGSPKNITLQQESTTQPPPPPVQRTQQLINALSKNQDPVAIAKETAPKLAWLLTGELLALLDQAGVSPAGRTAVADAIAARSAELDASSVPSLLRSLRRSEELPVKESLIEALIGIASRTPPRGLRTLSAALPALMKTDQPTLLRRLKILEQLLPQRPNDKETVATKPLRSLGFLPLSDLEQVKLEANVPIDPVSVINSKIPPDLLLVDHFAQSFVSKGAVIAPQAGTIVTDTGNALLPGIFDHHQIPEATCAAALVLNHVEHLIAHHRAQPIARLVTHATPDLDALTSTFLVSEILSKGKIGPEHVALAAYASSEDTARIKIADPSLSLAGLCHHASAVATRQVGNRSPEESREAWQQRRDQEAARMIFAILRYVIDSGLAPDDPSLFQNIQKLSPELQADISALQEAARVTETQARAAADRSLQLRGVLPRTDGAGVLDCKIAFATESNGKRTDQILRDRDGVDLVVVHTPRYVWLSCAPTAGASLRPIAAAAEILERARSREKGRDRLPEPDENGNYLLRSGTSVIDPWYLGGGDQFLVTPSNSSIGSRERVQLIAQALGLDPAPILKGIPR